MNNTTLQGAQIGIRQAQIDTHGKYASMLESRLKVKNGKYFLLIHL
jgi:hypothetical protein